MAHDDVDSAWPLVAGWLADATVDVEVLPVDPEVGDEQRRRLGVTERSVLGALTAHTGGLLVDHGWLRILGGGHGRLPGVAQQLEAWQGSPAYLVVADDVLGGRFAIDGGGLGIAAGEVCYFAPDTLDWDGTGLQHSGFLSWCLGSRLALFYRDLRWEGWRGEVAALGLDEGISLTPPPFTQQGHPIGAARHRAVPIAELHYFYTEAAARLGQLPEGSQLTIEVSGDRPATGPGASPG